MNRNSGAHPGRVDDRAEVRARVPVEVDRRRRNLHDRTALGVRPQQDCHLVLESIAWHAEQPADKARRVAAQAGLGVPQPRARPDPDEQSRRLIADSAAQRNVADEAACPQDDRPRLMRIPTGDSVCDSEDVVDQMLSVAVGADDVTSGPRLAHACQASLQCRTLAVVLKSISTVAPNAAAARNRDA